MSSNAGKIPGLITTIFVLDLIHRRTIPFYAFGISALCYFLLAPCSNRTIETILFFIISSAASIYLQVVFLVTTEFYPAEVRSSAMGISAAISRIGLILTPFVSEILSHPDAKVALIVYGLACALAATASIMIPFKRKEDYEHEETPLMESRVEIK